MAIFFATNLQQKKDIQVKGLNSIQFWLNWVFNKKKYPIDFFSILFADKEDPWGNWGEIFPSDNPFTVQIFLIPFSPIQILLTFDPFPWLEFLREKNPNNEINRVSITRESREKCPGQC